MVNLYVGWFAILAGLVAGAVIGMFFHREDWLEGYDSWRRRMLRLTHISMVGTGLLNRNRSRFRKLANRRSTQMNADMVIHSLVRELELALVIPSGSGLRASPKTVDCRGLMFGKNM